MENSDKYKQYVGLIEALKKENENLEKSSVARDYFVETSYWGVDLLNYVSRFRSLVDKTIKGEELDSTVVDKMLVRTSGYFKNYDLTTDRSIFGALIEMYSKASKGEYRPAVFDSLIDGVYKGNFDSFTEALYTNSAFVSEATMKSKLANWNKETALELSNDLAFLLTDGIYDNYSANIRPAYNAINANLDSLRRIYMKGLQTVLPAQKSYYPDANSTLRIAYGKVQGYQPVNAVHYDYYTTLDGVIEKYDPTTKEFDLPQKLIDLYVAKDYGRYASRDELPVCFIASNHTTGGNSGSPVLNGKGELIGLNFDRNWEGTMSDIMYDPTQCRNIAVDIRYVLFIIDKFAGAGYLLENMEIRN